MSKLEEKMKEVVTIWGREIELDVVFECYGTDSISDAQKATYQDWKANMEMYQTDAFEAICSYLKEKYADNLEDEEVKNIFKYVVPKELYFKQYTDDKKSFGIISHFKFDKENGLAVRFASGKVKKVGPEQIL